MRRIIKRLLLSFLNLIKSIKTANLRNVFIVYTFLKVAAVFVYFSYCWIARDAYFAKAVTQISRSSEIKFNTILDGTRDTTSEDIKTYIVTGASDNHYKSLTRLVKMVAEKMGDYNIELVIADIGLNQENTNDLFSEEFRSDLESRGAQFGVKTFTFDFENRPDWMSDLMKYAWKPLVIQEVIEQLGAERLFWIDAGCILNSEFSETAWTDYLNVLSTNGVVVPEGHDEIRISTHAGMQEYFMIAPNSSILDQPEIAATVVGIDLRVKDVKDRIIDPWFDCATKMNCLAPEGSSLDNHRYDQAALSIILRKANWPKDIQYIRQKYRFITIHRDVEMGYLKRFWKIIHD
eukprot:277350_1